MTIDNIGGVTATTTWRVSDDTGEWGHTLEAQTAALALRAALLELAAAHPTTYVDDWTDAWLEADGEGVPDAGYVKVWAADRSDERIASTFEGHFVEAMVGSDLMLPADEAAAHRAAIIAATA